MIRDEPSGGRDEQGAVGIPAPSPTVRQETCAAAAVRRVAALLDLDPDDIAEGQYLPQGWHFFLFAGDTRRSRLREDGFPGLGVELPDLGLPRLLIVGRDVDYLAPLAVGETVARSSSLVSVERRETGRGPIAVVKVRHSLVSAERETPSLIETQIYYLFSPAATRPQADADRPAVSAEHIRRVTPDDTMLFQYSALGFNSHKIHLDREYAQRVEGHKDLVVNGGLIVLLMTEMLRTEIGATLRSARIRHTAPLYCGRPITIAANRTEDGWHVSTHDDRGGVVAEMKAVTA